MDTVALTPLISRWIHLLCAVAAGGGILFYWIVLAPAARKALSAEQFAALREPMMRRLKMIVHPSIVLFLASGLYNYLVVLRPLHDGQALYHALFGTKFLLALAVFALALVLTSTRKWSENLRNGKLGWAVLSVLVIAVVMIGGYMKSIPAVSGPAAADAGMVRLSDE